MLLLVVQISINFRNEPFMVLFPVCASNSNDLLGEVVEVIPHSSPHIFVNPLSNDPIRLFVPHQVFCLLSIVYTFHSVDEVSGPLLHRRRDELDSAENVVYFDFLTERTGLQSAALQVQGF